MPEMPDFRKMFMNMARQKARRYRELNAVAVKGAVVLAGSSLMENFPVNEIMMSAGDTRIVYNRGISAMTIEQYDEFLSECVLELQPRKLFINIGSNDLNLPGDTVNNMANKYRALLKKIMEALPACEITLLAFYPVRPESEAGPGEEGRIVRTKALVNEANIAVKALAEELGLNYLDLNAPLMDENGYMKKEISTDQIHFSPAGYLPVYEQLKEYF